MLTSTPWHGQAVTFLGSDSPPEIVGPKRTPSHKRLGDAFERVFGRRNRRRRQSLFPSIESIRASVVDQVPRAPSPLRTLPPVTQLPEVPKRPPRHATELAPEHSGRRALVQDKVWFDDSAAIDEAWIQGYFGSGITRRHSGRAQPPQPLAPAHPESPLLPPKPSMTPKPRRSKPTQYKLAPTIEPPVIPERTTSLRDARYTTDQRYTARTLPDLLENTHQLDLAIRPSQEKKMAALQVALIYLLANEGSAYVNDAQDRGGPTRYGVTLGTLSNYIGRTATIAEVQNLTPAVVTDIYRRFYWTPIMGDRIADQQLATAMLDLAALCGPTVAVRMAQAACGAQPDGVMGPKTLAALNNGDPGAMLAALSAKACGYFSAIALRDPTQAKFLPGWQLRAHKMLRQPATVA